jgi:4-hydroxy-tetrahydrodipicolinate reductase
MVRVLVASPFGRTGGGVFFAAHRARDVQLVGGLVSEAHKGMTEGEGRGIVVPCPVGEDGDEVCVPMALSVKDAPEADVLIDFTSGPAAARYAAQCAEAGLAFVTGTTGLDDEEQAAVASAAERVAVVQSGNMSLGVAVLQKLVEDAARALGEGYDVEVSETHHRHKKDSPSGTAIMLGEAAGRGRNTSVASAGVFVRHGRSERRAPGEIGFAVRRGGGVYGDHDVSFLSDEEVVSLGHRALNREVFARGALRAAAWVHGQPPGLYSMRDVLGLR